MAGSIFGYITLGKTALNDLARDMNDRPNRYLCSSVASYTTIVLPVAGSCISVDCEYETA